MPVLEPVHIFEHDRATSRLELVRVNPTRGFMHVPLDETGHWKGTPANFTWQNGYWFDTGGNWIEDESIIPQRFRDEIAANPVTAGQPQGPAVTAVCKFCGEKMNQSDVEQHYIAHVTQAMQAAGTTKPSLTERDLEREADAASKEIQKITPKHDANQHRRS